MTTREGERPPTSCTVSLRMEHTIGVSELLQHDATSPTLPFTIFKVSRYIPMSSSKYGR